MLAFRLKGPLNGKNIYLKTIKRPFKRFFTIFFKISLRKGTSRPLSHEKHVVYWLEAETQEQSTVVSNQSDHRDPGNFPANCHMD